MVMVIPVRQMLPKCRPDIENLCFTPKILSSRLFNTERCLLFTRPVRLPRSALLLCAEYTE